MWRESAIRSLLLEEICGLPRIEPSPSDDRDDSESGLMLHKARLRAALVIAVDWAALLVLFVLRTPDRPWLPIGPTEESVFTFGILALAVHSGFRLGQLEKLRSVGRLLEDLKERSGRS
jgi:hypothetical protein